MALIIDKERSDGTIVGFWVAFLPSLTISVASDTFGNIEVTGKVSLKGYLNEAALLAGKDAANILLINDLTQDECGDLFKKLGKTNLKKEIYRIALDRTDWEEATEDNTNEDPYP